MSAHHDGGAPARRSATAELSRALRIGVPHDRSGRPLRTLAQVVADVTPWPEGDTLPDGVAVPAGESVSRTVERLNRLGDPFNARLLIEDPARGTVVVTSGEFFHRLATAFAHEALHDSLTGLPNRRSVREQLRRRLAEASPEQPVTLLFLDLDRFKDVNDQLGHEVGDAVLVDTASRLRGVVRRSDFLARLAGDEFVLLLADRPGEDDDEETGTDAPRPRPLDAIADRIQSAIAAAGAPVPDIGLSASVGYAIFDQPVEVGEALRRADTAMYRAKAAGGGATRSFRDPVAVTRRPARVHREPRTTIDGGDLRLDYQPVVRVGSSTVEEVEALLRWRDREHHEVPTQEFLDYAHTHRLMASVGRLVLDQACWQAASWWSSGVSVRVSVNLAGEQIADPRLVEDVLGTLSRYALPTSALSLDVTEAVASVDPRLANRQLRTLRAAGVRIALDDFGASSSSFAALRDLPVDVVKMDRALMASALDTERDRSLVRMVVETVHALDLECAAEGVETWAQHDVLTDLGVDMLQGFLLGRPAPAGSFRNDRLVAVGAGRS